MLKIRKNNILLLAVLTAIVWSFAGCGNKEAQESGFKNDKPVPAEDGGGAKS